MINPQKSKEKIGQKLTATINNSPLPVLIEYPDGREDSIVKAYFVTGRTAAVKILVGNESQEKEDQRKITDLEDTITSLESDIDDLEGAKDELEEWTNNFGDDAETTKTLWDAIEESISRFADDAGMHLTANDATNINALRDIYKISVQDLKDADEIIGELKLENLAKDKRIADLEKQLAGKTKVAYFK